MEGIERIFVDSNYFIGLFNPLDALHERAITIAREIETKQIPLAISNLIFLETVTILSQRGGRPIAIRGGQYFFDDPNMKIVHIDEQLQRDSWTVFQEVEKKDVSFVDCSTVAAMRAEGVRTLLTFDRAHFMPLSRRYRFKIFEAS